MSGNLTGGLKMRETMIAKFQEPGMTREEAEAAWKDDMRTKASKGGKNGTGHQFGHGKVSPELAGHRGGIAKKRNRKAN